VGTTSGATLTCRFPDHKPCSGTKILGSTTDFRLVAAGAAGNPFGKDVVVGDAALCSKLTRTSGNLRCDAAKLTYVNADGETLYYLGLSGSEIPMGASPDTC